MSSAVRLQFEQSTTDAIEAWQEGIRTKAIDVIQRRLPEKILALNQRLAQIDKHKAELLHKSRYFEPETIGADYEVHQPGSEVANNVQSSGNKKRKTADGESATNGVPSSSASTSDPESHTFTGIVHIAEYFARAFGELRQEWDELIEITDSLKMYINLQMPQIEDGDTFGVSVQEEALNEVVRTQDSAYGLLATPFNFHSVRGDLAAKCVRFPGVQDYRQALIEHDTKSMYKLKMQVTDIRNMYAVVFDILKKNITKISKPKSGNQMGYN